MQILNLHVTNFRNFSSKKFVFDPKLTVVVGQNGSGKSNMLEAVGLLAATRAKKVDTDLDLVKFGQAEAKIEGEVHETPLRQDSAGQVKLTINLQVDEAFVARHPGVATTTIGSRRDSIASFQNDNFKSGRVRKSYFIDEIKKRLIDFTEHFSVIVFEPSDLDLISGSPSERRHHLDILLSVLDRDYWRAISAYGKVVTRRNRVLQRIQEGKAKKTELDFWDERLLEHGGEVSRKRKEFFEFINFVNGEKGAYKWELEESVLSDEKLERNRERDIAAGVTLSGPHRDDFKFLFRGKNLEYFGSRGEQRMSVLALKLSELELFNAKRGDRPILALDDIFSELDWEHREAVMGVIKKQQTIITAAEGESVPKKLLKTSKVIQI